MIRHNPELARSTGTWPIQMLPFDPNAHVITNVGAFAHCRGDSFCRCRKCKPPLHHLKGKY